jgi:hypothetical protein
LKSMRLRHLLAALITVAAVTAAASAQTSGSSPTDPAPAGLALSGIIECGEGYTSHELYDMKITLVEAVRGEEAWKHIRAANNSNKPAPPETEYVLARIKFEYHARGNPGTCIHSLGPEQFTAYAPNGEAYKAVDVVPPKPVLRKDLKSGEIIDGWIVFAVAKQDKAPLIYYSVDQGGGTQHGGGKWFAIR